ncbi:class II aldolase/adducin family protein [Candidatus Woesearchaeota archaeon]|nr:class II aldolase/adducin family protein [Candidatus Woesearchaeota archaeon]
MKDEGYIKFNIKQTGKEIIPKNNFLKINRYRKKLHNLGLIGMYKKGEKKGIGFGNISMRTKDGFIITGSATGGIEDLDPEHYSEVVYVDIGKNYLEYNGPAKPSSESMTHAAIYKQNKNVDSVIHVHSLRLWKKLLNKFPTAGKSAKYGTPEMAYEIERLFRKTDVKEKKIIVAAGHREGIFVFGKDLKEAFSLIQKVFSI